jgi:hypothetical protein
MSRASAWFCFVLFCLAKALQMGAFCWLAGFTMRWRMAIPATAALWVLIEYTHGPMGFAWLDLGNAAIDMGIPMRLAPLTGVWGLSFLFAAIAAEGANLALKKPGIPFLGLALIPLLWLLPAVPSERNGSVADHQHIPVLDDVFFAFEPRSRRCLFRAAPRIAAQIHQRLPVHHFRADELLLEIGVNRARGLHRACCGSESSTRALPCRPPSESSSARAAGKWRR